MSPFARAFDNAAHDERWRFRDSDAYQRGLEIDREKTVDDGDFDDDYETHCQRERLNLMRDLI